MRISRFGVRAGRHVDILCDGQTGLMEVLAKRTSTKLANQSTGVDDEIHGEMCCHPSWCNGQRRFNLAEGSLQRTNEWSELKVR